MSIAGHETVNNPLSLSAFDRPVHQEMDGFDVREGPVDRFDVRALFEEDDDPARSAAPATSRGALNPAPNFDGSGELPCSIRAH